MVSLIVLCAAFLQDTPLNNTGPGVAHNFPELNCPEYLPNVSTVNANQQAAGQFAGNTGIDQDWFSIVTEQILQEEYNISSGSNDKKYQSYNRANNLKFSYESDGFAVEPAERRIPLYNVNDRMIREEDKTFKEVEFWKAELKLDCEKFAGSGSGLNVSGNKAWTENEYMRMEYFNTKEGMRQDFIIKQKPVNENGLELAINLISELKLSVNRYAVTLSSVDGEDKMKYGSLKVYDAAGRILESYFEMKNSKQFAIVVDDNNAEYPVTIDPLSTIPSWVEDDGNTFIDRYEVEFAGDIDLDGYSDVIFGSPGDMWSAGTVRVIFGSQGGLATGRRWRFDDNSYPRTQFGSGVAGNCDVNGDGFKDLVVGAPLYQNGQAKEGRLYVFYGSALGLPDSPNWSYESNVEFARLGYSVGFAGDYNGDGYDDIIVGAPGYPNDYLSAHGRVFIFLGSANGLSNGPVYQFINWFDGYTGIGEVVGGAGDVNGDGYDDIYYGEPYWPPPPSLSGDNVFESNGRFLVSLGSPSGHSGWGGGGEGEGDRALFGYSISGRGDINNDGYSDLIVGSPNLYINIYTLGKVYVYLGSPGGLTYAGSPNVGGYGLGASVSIAGDLNADGYDDAIFGAQYTAWDSQDTSMVTANVCYGSANGLRYNPEPWNFFYSGGSFVSVDGIGDVNADGYSDVMVVTLLKDTHWNNQYPKRFAYYGSNDPLSPSADWTTTGGGSYGYSVSGAGDVNGDGFDDVIVGAPRFSNPESEEGKVYLYPGSASGLSTSAMWTFESNSPGALFGEPVSSAGDVNGDGFADIIIGASRYNSFNGRAYVFHGSNSGLGPVPDWIRESYSQGLEFGCSISGAGDVNNDNYSDVIVGIGSMDHQGPNNIGAYIYLGSPGGLSTTEAWTASSTSPIDFGRSVSGAGDVNNDGFDDVIVGWNTALLFYGGASRGMYQAADWTSPYTANSVSNAGDVNGDGFDDIIIGRFSGGLDNQFVHVFLGSAQGLPATHNWYSGLSSWSVSTAGDFNNDGFDDILIGGSMDGPSVWLFSGSPTGLGGSSFMYVNYEFETSVSDAGDVNGDGFDDFVVGELFGGSAHAFYGRGSYSSISYFRVTPRDVLSVLNGNACFSGLVKDILNRPVPNVWVRFVVKGTNHSSQWLQTDNAGIARFCYSGQSPGRDTIIAEIRDVTADTVFATWDYPAPVEMLAFTSSVEGRNVDLKWTTSSELNNSGFDIERAAEGGEWSKLGFVNGSGTVSERRDYAYTDRNIETGSYRYRLKQIDFNGNFEYYELPEVVSIGVPDKYELTQNYPNPFNPVTTISYGLPDDGIVTIKVYDMLGREVKTLVNEMKTAGYYKIQFTAADLAGGAYFCRMKAGNFVAVKRMVLLK